MNLQRILDVDHEPLSMQDIKTQLRITDTSSNDFIRLIIAAVRTQVENYIHKTLITSTWQVTLDSFPDEIQLPMGMIQSITSINYVDTDGATQLLDPAQYQFDIAGRLKPSYGNEWPDTRDQYDAVTIIYVAGWEDAGDVPEDIKHAMKLIIGDYDINREDSTFVPATKINHSAKYLLNAHRVHML